MESEIKLRVASAEAARAAVRSLGATLSRPRHFEDNVLFDETRATLRASGRVLRLRRTGSGALLTYKGPRRDEQGIKRRPEIETPVSDPDAMQAVLEALGYRPVFRYQKFREVHRWDDVEIVVDETPVGTFLEIEGRLESIHRAAAALGYGPPDYITESYPSLFFAAGGTGDMVFP